MRDGSLPADPAGQGKPQGASRSGQGRSGTSRPRHGSQEAAVRCQDSAAPAVTGMCSEAGVAFLGVTIFVFVCALVVLFYSIQVARLSSKASGGHKKR